MTGNSYIELIALVNTANRLSLKGKEKYMNFSGSALKETIASPKYDWRPYMGRDKISDMMIGLEPALAILDMDFAESDGTYESYEAAIRRFRDNGNSIAKDKHGFFTTDRYVMMFNVFVLSVICMFFGWDKWIAAANANNEGFVKDTAVSKVAPAKTPFGQSVSLYGY